MVVVVMIVLEPLVESHVARGRKSARRRSRRRASPFFNIGKNKPKKRQKKTYDNGPTER